MNSRKRLKILVNAIPAVRVSTGIGRYVLSLYAAMGKLYADELDISYWTGGDIAKSLHNTHAEPGVMSSSSAFWKLPGSVSVCLRYALMRKREAFLRRRIHEFDLFHETSFFPPPLADTPVLFTLHDLSLLRFPQWHPKERTLFFDAFFYKRFAYADHILTVSHHTRNDYELLLPGLGGKPVTVTHLGIDETIFHPWEEREVEEVVRRYRLPERFVLTVGSGDPRKNMQGLLAAFPGKELDLPLVVAGWKGWHWPELPDNVIHLGYVPDKDLSRLYAGARFFVYPSFHEGFGLPVLEAMACGCPVLTSRVSSIPEVGRGHALYFDPASREDLARKMRLLALDDARRDAMKRGLLASGMHFGWDATAKKTYEAIASLLH